MKMNNQIKLANIKMLEFVASKLGTLCDDVVFLGGCTTALLITDPNTPDARHTFDVDCIVDVISHSQFRLIEKRLIEHGFKQSIQDDILCRWRYDDVILDVMPTDEKILGFGNRWYKAAIQNAFIYPLTDQLNIKVVTAPYFLGTKLEAFKTRGNMDFYASHDFEDIISVLDGRVEIIDEIEKSEDDLKKTLISSFSDILKKRSFKDALHGHFIHYGNLADDRIVILLNKLEQILK